MPEKQTALGYRATRTAPNELTIHRVEIFCTCSRGDIAFDDKWIASAVSKARMSEREGYFPPLHIRHHNDGGDVRAAGFFRVVGTGPITLRGSRRTAIFADLVITDQPTIEEILAKRLLYRSVEIFNVDQPSIDSLALLDYEAPFLELPLLFVGNVKETVGSSIDLGVAGATFSRFPNDASSPLVASFTRGKAAQILFKQEGFVMADEPEDKKDEKEDGEGEKMEAAPLDVDAVVAAIKDRSVTVAQMDAILAAIQEAQAEKVPEEEAGEDKIPAEVPGGAMMRAENEAMSAKFAKLSGEHEAMKAKFRQIEATAQRDREVALAMKRLDNRPLGADLEQNLIKFHADHGPKAFEAYVAAIEKSVAPEMAEGHFGLEKPAPKAPSIALSYLDYDGTGAVDAATKFCAEYDAQRGIRASREDYVAINMAKAGFTKPTQEH
jgi:hypothetical protein